MTAHCIIVKKVSTDIFFLSWKCANGPNEYNVLCRNDTLTPLYCQFGAVNISASCNYGNSVINSTATFLATSEKQSLNCSTGSEQETVSVGPAGMHVYIFYYRAMIYYIFIHALLP